MHSCRLTSPWDNNLLMQTSEVALGSYLNQLGIATVSAISSAAVGMLAGPDSLTSSLFDNPTIPALAKTALNAAQDAFTALIKDLAPGVSIQNGILGPCRN